MRERKLSDYYVGQEVWDFQFGLGKVKEITNKTKPIRCIFNEKDIVEYLTNGKAYAADTNPSLFFEEISIPESANTPKKWTPKDGEKYYSITESRGHFLTLVYVNNGNEIDKDRIRNKNAFKTDEEARTKLDKILELMKGE